MELRCVYKTNNFELRNYKIKINRMEKCFIVFLLNHIQQLFPVSKLHEILEIKKIFSLNLKLNIILNISLYKKLHYKKKDLNVRKFEGIYYYNNFHILKTYQILYSNYIFKDYIRFTSIQPSEIYIYVNLILSFSVLFVTFIYIIVYTIIYLYILTTIYITYYKLANK